MYVYTVTEQAPAASQWFQYLDPHYYSWDVPANETPYTMVQSNQEAIFANPL